jgi:hypothetical protein
MKNPSPCYLTTHPRSQFFDGCYTLYSTHKRKNIYMPAIIFCDGFDTYTTILDKWDVLNFGGSSGVPPVISPGVGRGGAGALSVVSAGPAIAQNMNLSVSKNIGAHTTLYVGFAFYWTPASQNADCAVLQFSDGSTVQVSLNINTSGTLYFTRGGLGGTVLGSMAAVAYPSNSFHYVEVEVVISPTVGVCQLKIDQASVLNLTGLNTQASTNTTFGTVTLGTISPVNKNCYTAYFDDVVFDTAGFNGDVRVSGQLPSGNGSTQNFSNVEASWVANTVTNLQTIIVDSNSNLQRCTAITLDFKTGTTPPTWATITGNPTTDNHVTWTCLGPVSQFKLVNESDPDGDSSYIQSNTVNDASRFTYPAISGSSVLGVVIWANARKDDGGERTIQGSIKSGGTVGTTGTDMPLGTNYQSVMLQSLTDPNTGAAWTLPAVNAAEFGIKITS